MKEIIGTAIGVVLAAMVVWNLAMSGGVSGYVENVESTADWDQAIDEANSNDYNVTNDTLVMGNNSNVQTVQASIGDISNATFEAEVKTGSVTVTIYDENDIQIFSGSGSGGDTITHDFASTDDQYYVEFVNQQSSDSEVDTYQVKGDEADSFGMFRVLIIALIGAGLIAVFN